jgi:cytochrome c1
MCVRARLDCLHDDETFVRRLAQDFTADITTLWDTSHVNEPTLMEAAVDKKREDIVAFLKEMGWPEE